ncbi:MAG TPA: hypothetical protein VNE42_05050 [Acidimicrobiales bacterium]|nr:hypothetical protein [Acidimicrobiales bacterium]
MADDRNASIGGVDETKADKAQIGARSLAESMNVAKFVMSRTRPD